MAIASLNLTDRSPRGLTGPLRASLTVTGRGQAREDRNPPPSWWHWSNSGPLAEGADAYLEPALYTKDYRM